MTAVTKMAVVSNDLNAEVGEERVIKKQEKKVYEVTK